MKVQKSYEATFFRQNTLLFPSFPLIEPGSEKSVKYQVLLSFDIVFMRCKFTSPGIKQVCKRVLLFREFAQNSVAIPVHLVRVREQA